MATSSTDPPPVFTRPFCRTSIVGAGLVAGEVLAALLAMAPEISANRWEVFGLSSLLVQWIMLVSLASLCFLQRRFAIASLWQLVGVTLCVVLGATWMICSLALKLAPIESLGNPLQFFLRGTGIALAVSLLGFLAFRGHLQSQELAARIKQAELESLQARIRPHFLFNTLNTAVALVRARPAEAERLLLDLSDLFRAALAGPQEIKLADEIALTRRYLEIEELRFGERLQVQWSLPDQLPDILVPSLSIQPLAENAIRHGIEPRPEGGLVDIKVTTDADWARIVIGNDVSERSITAIPGYRIGLNSARERIRASSRGMGGIATAIVDGRHIATVTLPRRS
jgi:two-component system sensor histidine kinase AlgZ